MKGWWPLAALGLGAFVVFALATLPAQLLLTWLEPSGVSAAGVSGTAWKGRAQVIVVQGTRVGALEWDLHALKLFTARLAADVKVTRVDGFLQADATLLPSGRLQLSDLRGSAPLHALPPNIVRGGWTGTLNLRLDALTLDEGWPTHAAGSVEVIDLTGPANRPVHMGSYQVTFPPDADGSETLSGALKDSGGPLQVNGTVQLHATDRRYVIAGLIAARPDAPRDVANALQFLGPPDEQGRVEFGMEGTL
jgi:general secretion pathway protein N